MDSLTQIVVGIATAEACLGKQLKNRTFIYGAIIATIPDLDVYVGKLFDPLTAIELHRGFSHSVIFYLLFSVILGSILFKIEKQKISIFQAINATFFILLTHSIIDAFTTWGTQIFWPLPYRIAIKSIFVVDLFYTIPWIICLIYIFKNQQNNIRLKWLKRGFVITTSYLLLGLLVKIYVTQKFESALAKQNIQYSDIIVKPTFSNIILWNANVKTSDSFLLSDYSLFDKHPIKFKTYSQNLDLAANFQQDLKFKKLKNISEGWFTLQQKNDSILFNDLRFGLLKEDVKNPQFAFSYVLDTDADELQVAELPKKNKDGKTFLLKIIYRVFNGNQ